MKFLVSSFFLAAVALANEGDVLWTYDAWSPVRTCPAVAEDGTIYLGTNGGYLEAVTSSGQPKWFYYTFFYKGIESSPAIDSAGNIYFGDFGGYVYSLDALGNQLWFYKTGAAIHGSPAIAANGTIYVGSNGLYAFTPTGELKWRYECGHVYSSPAVGPDGVIYFADGNGYLYAINPGGSFLWKYEIGEAYAQNSPAIAADGSIYICNHDSKLYALNHDGSLKWTYQLGEPDEDNWCFCNSSPSIAGDGTIYLGTFEVDYPEELPYGHLYAINTDGSLKWRFFTPTAITSTAAVGSDEVIYFPSGVSWGFVDPDSCFLYALNQDGSLRWKHHMPEASHSSPTIDSSGAVYVGSEDEYLYALESSSEGLASSYWPKFQHDVRNTGRVDDEYLCASFYAEPRDGCSPLAVQFHDESTGPINSWHWVFGDGFESNNQNPVHTYDTCGIYTVTLSVSNDLGQDSHTESDYITARGFPEAEFCADPLEGPSVLEVQFTDETTGLPESWDWDFGDGHASNGQNPSHIYSSDKPRTYDVTLIVENCCGVDTIIKEKYVEILAPELNTHPDSLIAELPPEGRDTVTLSISNQGNYPMEYKIYKVEDVNWLTFDYFKGQGEVEPGEDVLIDFYFDAAGYQDGSEITLLEINTNDYDKTPYDMVCVMTIDPSAVSEDCGAPRYFYLGDLQTIVPDYVNVSYGVPRPSRVAISIYGIDGRLVRTLTQGTVPAGNHQVLWDMKDNKGRRLARGVYFCRMVSGDFSASRKITVIE